MWTIENIFNRIVMSKNDLKKKYEILVVHSNVYIKINNTIHYFLNHF